jgi:hypothetical protein
MPFISVAIVPSSAQIQIIISYNTTKRSLLSLVGTLQEPSSRIVFIRTSVGSTIFGAGLEFGRESRDRFQADVTQLNSTISIMKKNLWIICSRQILGFDDRGGSSLP